MVRNGPLAGLFAQVTVLAALELSIGLDKPGWAVGVGYATVTAVLLHRGLAGGRFGPADWVTQARTVLIGGVTALIADAFHRDPPVTAIAALVVVALLLDGVDGQVARRTGTASAFGARFDMEIDSFLLLALSVYVARDHGAWVLAIGGMRYAFLLGIWTTGWMRGQLPPRYWRKVVAAVQGIALVVATAGVLADTLTVAALVAALTLLVESFGRDVLWLWHDGHPVGSRLGIRDGRSRLGIRDRAGAAPVAVVSRQRDRDRVDAGHGYRRSATSGAR